MGQELPEGPYSPITILGNSPHGTRDFTDVSPKGTFDFAIEAWVIPDCGGIIASCEGQFKLEIGNVDTAGPATFTINVEGKNGNEPIKLTTAKIQVQDMMEQYILPLMAVYMIHTIVLLVLLMMLPI